jgi:predicted metal-dependent phosphoesterase TrpH
MARMKIDLHCHTEASWDCITALADIPAQCRRVGIGVQAITDHNEVWGAQRLQEMVVADGRSDLTIIIGEEVTTTEGEIIGLFLSEKIEAGLSPEETVRQIKAQNGLVLLPHGFDPLKRYRLQPPALERIAADVDIVETFNARISQPRWNAAAVTWAAERNILMSAGSDAHRLVDIGSAWVEAPLQPVGNAADLRQALRNAQPTGQWTHPVLAFVLKMWEQAQKRFAIRR